MSQILVWRKEPREEYEAAWCVSVCDDDGQEIRCLSTHYDYDDAIAAGREAAQQHGLRLCERSLHGTSIELASAETMKMQAMLLFYGPRYSGKNVERHAQDWLDLEFSPEAADDWCMIGVWYAVTAAELRDAGLTPQQVVAAAERLTEGLEDPAECYTDGDPIYAACAGDIDTSEIIEAAQ